MRIAIVGVGGVGGLLGGMLARAGTDVVFVARGAQLEAIRRDGLRVEGAVGQFTVKPDVVASPAEAGKVDAVLVAVKAWQVAQLAPQLASLGGFVVPLQNGLEAHDTLAKALGEERVVGGLCHMLSMIAAPGVVKQQGFQPSVTIGEWKGGGSARCEQLAAELTRAGVKAIVAKSVQTALWEKAMFVEALGAVGAAMRLPVGAWRAVPESRELLTGAMRETASVARAYGAQLGEADIRTALERIDALPAEGTASMHRDLEAHRPSELDDQTGAIVRLANVRSVDVPVHRFLLACLLPHEQAARQRS